MAISDGLAARCTRLNELAACRIGMDFQDWVVLAAKEPNAAL